MKLALQRLRFPKTEKRLALESSAVIGWFQQIGFNYIHVIPGLNGVVGSCRLPATQ